MYDKVCVRASVIRRVEPSGGRYPGRRDLHLGVAWRWREGKREGGRAREREGE